MSIDTVNYIINAIEHIIKNGKDLLKFYQYDEDKNEWHIK